VHKGEALGAGRLHLVSGETVALEAKSIIIALAG